jgi:hypothetical protein
MEEPPAAAWLAAGLLILPPVPCLSEVAADAIGLSLSVRLLVMESSITPATAVAQRPSPSLEE